MTRQALVNSQPRSSTSKVMQLGSHSSAWTLQMVRRPLRSYTESSWRSGKYIFTQKCRKIAKPSSC